MLKHPFSITSSTTFLVMIFFLSAVNASFSQRTDKNADEPRLIKNTMELLNQGKHDSVLAICDQLMRDHPESPTGYFLAADAYETMNRDFRLKTYRAPFDSLIRLAVTKAEAKLAQEPASFNYFSSGIVKSYYCLALFQTGHYIKAIKTAEKGISLLRKSHALEPDFVDPLMGIAAYEYHKSKLLFGLLGGSEKEAIVKFKKVVKLGRYLSTNAAYSLQAIYFENAHYDSALMINDQLFLKYPENPSCLYMRALLLEQARRLPEALQIWNRLIAVVSAPQPSSNGYLAECHYHVAAIHRQLDQADSAWASLMQAARFAANRRADAELEGSHAKFKEIKSNINKALREWKRNDLTPIR